jgi:tetrahedral aminopeptidase
LHIYYALLTLFHDASVIVFFMKPFFKELITIPSISGDEQELQKLVDRELKKHVDTIHTDILGNNIKEIGKGKIKVMLTAHCDEVGFIVTYVDEKGFAYFQPIGGIDKDIAVGQRVKIKTNDGIISGVIGRDTEHEITKQSKMKDLWIDTGVAEKGNKIAVGNRIFFDTYYDELQNNCIIARGGDNAVGVYITTEITKIFSKDPNKNLKLVTVLSTQEEIGLRGAHIAVKEVAPKYAFVIDTTDATDTPNASKEQQGAIYIGRGPVISYGPGTDKNLFFKLKEIAEREKIPLQIVAQANKTSTDTDTIQIGSMGVMSMIVSIPVRYMHTPNVLFHWQDVEHTIQLITSMLKHLEEQ